jgi:hypothetical protein
VFPNFIPIISANTTNFQEGCFTMSSLASDLFSPPKPRSVHPETLSKNPKTVANRKAIRSKSGLRIAYFRADSAFRAAKSRSLKALHRNANWSSWDDKQKQKAESDMIKKLEKKRNERKRKAEIALYAKWAKEEAQDDEAVSDVPKAKKSRGMTKEKEDESVQESDADESMESEDDESEDDESEDDESMESEDDEWVTESDDGWGTELDDAGLIKSLTEVKKAAGKSFFTMMTQLEAKAEASSAALAEALHSADQEE